MVLHRVEPYRTGGNAPFHTNPPFRVSAPVTWLLATSPRYLETASFDAICAGLT